MDGGKIVALPSLIAQAVELKIVNHRRDRKVLFVKKPAKWQEKLERVNSQIMTIVFDSRQNALASAAFLRKSVSMVNGQLEFTGTGRNHELLRLKFVLSGEQQDPSGAGSYFLYSKTFPEREICCVSSTSEERSGYDILREAYSGLMHVHMTGFAPEGSSSSEVLCHWRGPTS